ncbi:GntR family transcriptional regulator [Pseudomonas sp. OIL-1]|uniref:GntR family transcriptional regulator n=1 Tax=Pseudomonas sp. OIL-1 TaxID=2706126 RepID=UPI0013A73928|nr:GntR family transcriptional regulator [Pseudomonas sp. OIL-1]QIB50004.1 GntR family transcriptional regulator [Pseudomonas sp. OIL-1]
MKERRSPSAAEETDNDPVTLAPKKSGRKGSGHSEWIYRAISNAVIEHRLKPGARLREDALAEVFGISRTGIRKVLQRLALEQLITLTPGKGATVARPSAEEAREIFDARRMIEGALMSRLASRVTASQIRALRDLARQELQALQGDEQSAAIKASAAFHGRLAELAGNQTLARFVAQLCSRSSLILAVYGQSGDLGCDCNDHNQLVDLLEAGNSDGAAAFMQTHLHAIESSLSIDEVADETPDLHDVFAVEQGEESQTT